MVGHIDSRDSAQKPAVVFRNKANRGVLDAIVLCEGTPSF